jgi:hypothetical protein
VNTTLVVEQMMRGAKSIYVDYLDYDEVAHHAGIARPESLATLAGLDKVVGQIEFATKFAPRPYHLVLVSDHGQSQGAVFAQRYQPLEDLVHGLMRGDPSVHVESDGESYGPLNTLLTDASQGEGVSARVTRSALNKKMQGGSVRLGPADTKPPPDEEVPDIVVVGSGNLGAVWFAQHPERQTVESMTESHPDLIPGLAAHPGVGFLVALSAHRGAVAIGRDGVHYLEEDVVDGVDPLAHFGEQAAADFRRVAHFSNAPDLYLNSFWNPERSEVAAFEGLVGCHGGLGGWQNRGLVVHPAGWTIDSPISGADGLHRQLVHWLETLGHRASLPSLPPQNTATRPPSSLQTDKNNP